MATNALEETLIAMGLAERPHEQLERLRLAIFDGFEQEQAYFQQLMLGVQWQNVKAGVGVLTLQDIAYAQENALGLKNNMH